jgi:hypothetical protein
LSGTEEKCWRMHAAARYDVQLLYFIFDKKPDEFDLSFTRLCVSTGYFYISGRQKTCAHQNDIVWTLFDPVSTTFIHF